MADSKAPTHTAYALKREGRRYGRWLEIGTGRWDGTAGVMHGVLDRLPIGGFSGYIYYAPIGQKPPEPEPERPAQVSDPEDEDI